MSAGIYTTTVDILGGQPTQDEWGDPVESDAVVKAGVPAKITERHETVSTESDAQVVTVHYYVGRLPHGTPVTDSNRLRDSRTGHIYQVDHVSVPEAVGAPGDVRVDLRRVT